MCRILTKMYPRFAVGGGWSLLFLLLAFASSNEWGEQKLPTRLLHGELKGGLVRENGRTFRNVVVVVFEWQDYVVGHPTQSTKGYASIYSRRTFLRFDDFTIWWWSWFDGLFDDNWLIWWYDNLTISRFDVWWFDHLFDDLRIWLYGDWRFDDLIWRFDDLTIRRFEDLMIWRFDDSTI